MIQAIIVLLIGIPGLLVNLTNIYIFLTTKSLLLGTPYRYLTISRCIANAYVLLTFISYVAPANIAMHALVSHRFASVVGVLTGAPTGCIIAIQMFLALQRFFAVYKPALYQKSLSYPASTVIQLCLCWTWGIFVAVFWEIASMCSDCSYSFNEKVAAWGDNCPPSFTLYTITVPVYISTATVFSANVLILFKLKAASNRVEYVNSIERRRNGTRIRRIVLQGICQDSTFLFETFMFNYAGSMSDNIMWWFICYSLVGVPGLLANVFNIYLFYKRKSLHNSYGFLTISRCIANAHVLLTFICYVAPANISNQVIISDNFASFISTLPAVSSGSIVASQLFLVLLRFAAIFKPVLYKTTLKSSKATVIQLCLSWGYGIIGLAFWIVAPMYDGCVFTFDIEVASWDDDCPPEFSLYTISIPAYICSGLVFLVNFLILYKLRAVNEKNMSMTDNDKRRNENRVRRMLIQGSIQDSTFLFETLVFNFAPVTSAVEKFICYSFVWELSHVLDGVFSFIVMLFNVKSLPRSLCCNSGSDQVFVSVKSVKSVKSQSTLCCDSINRQNSVSMH